MALRLLLADEGSSIKKAFEIALKDFGVTVKAVHQGVDVKEIFESFQPDICFLDVLLPKLNGYDVCSSLKKESSNKDCPIILMWSGFMELDQEKFKSSKAEGSLEKPFDSKDLRNLVMKHIPSLSQNEISRHIVVDENISAFQEQEQESLPDLPLTPEQEKTSFADNIDIPPLRQDSLSIDDLPDIPDLEDFTSDNELENNDVVLDGPVGLFDEEEEWSSQKIDGDEVHMSPEGLDDIDAFSVSSLDHPPFDEDSESSETTAPSIELKEEEEEEEEEAPSPLQSDANTSSPDALDDEASLDLPPLDDNLNESEPTLSPEEATSQALKQLSKEEIKRLILAQSKDIIESVVWDVVPELAREMIQKEIKRLTGEIKYDGDLR